MSKRLTELGGIQTHGVLNDPKAAWTWGKGDWDQTSGTLKFTVTSDIMPLGSGHHRLSLGITLNNRAVAQTAVRPFVRICGSSSWPAEPGRSTFNEQSFSGPPLMGSNKWLFGSMSDCSTGCPIYKANSQDTQELLAMVTFDSLPASGEMAVSALEAITGRGLSQPMHGKLARPHSTVPCNKATAADPAPTCSAIAGKELSLIDVQLSGGSAPSANLTLTIPVDPSVIKGRGGCYTTETKTPDVDDATAFQAETPKPMKLRSGWSEFCPEIQSGQSQSCTPGATQHTAMEWFPPRFGHAVKTVGTSTVLIFGGIGCSLWGETVNPGVNQAF